MSNTVKDSDLLIDDSQQEDVVSFGMKRFFPTPESVEQSAFKDYALRLKKAFDKNLNQAPFIFIAKFQFADEEAPFVFIGHLTAAWKKAISSRYKLLNEYARGYCYYSDDTKTLEFEVTGGKGHKERNLRLINRDLLRKVPGKPQAIFRELSEQSKSIAAKLDADIKDEVEGLVEEVEGTRSKVVSPTHTIVGRIQQEMNLLQGMSREDHKAFMDKALLINNLIEEWGILYKEHTSERLPEKAYVEKVKQHIEKHILQSKAFKTLEIKEFGDEWKDCQRMYSEALRLSVSNDLDEQKEAREATGQAYENLVLLQTQVRVWKNENPDAYKSHTAFFDELLKRIQQSLKTLAESNPEIKDLDPARAQANEFGQRWEALGLTYADFEKILKEKKSLEESEKNAADQLYLGLMRFHKDCLTWLEGNPQDKQVKFVQDLRKKADTAMQGLRKANFVREEYVLDDADLWDLFKRYKDLEKTLKDLQSRHEQIVKLGSKTAKPEELEQGKQLYGQQRIAIYQQLDRLNDLRYDLRQWEKIQSEKPSDNDTKRRNELNANMQKLFLLIDKMLSGKDRIAYYQTRQGFDPKTLENLAKDTELPKLSIPALPGTEFKKIKTIYQKYQDLSPDDLENRRLTLQELLEAIQDWHSSKSINKESEKNDVLKLQDVVFEHLKRINVFSSQHDNFFEILDRFEKLKKQEAGGLDQILQDQAKIEELQEDIDRMEEDIQAWQRLHYHLSGYGTRNQNKKLEQVRWHMSDFIERLEQQRLMTNTQGSMDALLQTGLFEDRTKLVYALALVCIETALKSKKDIGLSERALDAAKHWIQKQKLDETEAALLKKTVEENIKDQKTLRQTFDSNSLKVLESVYLTPLKEEAQTPAIATDLSPNKNLNRKRSYILKNDKNYDKLVKLREKLLNLDGKLDKRNLKLTKNKAEFLGLMESFYITHRVWAADMTAHEPNPDWEKAMKDISGFVNSPEYKGALEIIEGVETTREVRKVIGGTKKSIEGINKKMQQARKKLEELKNEKNEKNENKILEARKKLIAAQDLLFQQSNLLAEQIAQYKEGHDKLSEELQNTSNKKQKLKEVEKLQENIAQSIEKAFPDSRLGDKTKVYDKIVLAYEAYLKASLEKRDLDAVKSIENLILDWNQLLIVSKKQDVIDTLQKQAEKIKEVQDLLNQERLRLNDSKMRPVRDELFEQIKAQYQTFKELIEEGKSEEQPKAQAQRIGFLLVLIERWNKEHAAEASVEATLHREDVETWEKACRNRLKDKTLRVEFAKSNWSIFLNDLTQKMKEEFQKVQKFSTAQEQFVQNWNKHLENLTQKIESITDENLNKEKIDATALYQEQCADFWEMDLQEHRKEEQLVLGVFEGADLSKGLDYLQSVIPTEDLQKINQAIESALQRARKAVEFEQYDKAERLLAHVPVAFWPDDLLEDMRLWQNIQRQFGQGIQDDTDIDGMSQEDMDALINNGMIDPDDRPSPQELPRKELDEADLEKFNKMLVTADFYKTVQNLLEEARNKVGIKAQNWAAQTAKDLIPGLLKKHLPALSEHTDVLVKETGNTLHETIKGFFDTDQESLKNLPEKDLDKILQESLRVKPAKASEDDDSKGYTGTGQNDNDWARLKSALERAGIYQKIRDWVGQAIAEGAKSVGTWVADKIKDFLPDFIKTNFPQAEKIIDDLTQKATKAFAGKVQEFVLDGMIDRLMKPNSKDQPLFGPGGLLDPNKSQKQLEEEKKQLEEDKKKESEKSDLSKGLDATKFALGTLVDVGTGVIDVAKLAGYWYNVYKMDKMDPKRQKEIMKGILKTTNVAIKQANAITKRVSSGMDTFGGTEFKVLPGVQIAQGVLKSLTLIFDIAYASIDKAQNTPSITDFIKNADVLKALDDVSDIVLAAGGGIGDIVNIFVPAGSVITSAFGLAGDCKAFVKSAVNTAKAWILTHKTQKILEKAAQQDSPMLYAMRRQTATAKQKAIKETVNLAGDAVKVVGSTVTLVGACVSLAPEPEVQAAAIGIKLAGTAVRYLGGTIQVLNKIAFFGVDLVNDVKVMKLLNRAKTDRQARLEVMANSKVYAKKALIAGLKMEDPIALEYCVMRGFTEKDLTEQNAQVILQKFLKMDDEGETGLLEKAKKQVDSMIETLKKIGGILHFDQPNTETIRQLKISIRDIELSARLHKSIITGLEYVAMGAAIIPVVNLVTVPAPLIAHLSYLAIFEKQIKSGAQKLGEVMDKCHQRIDDLSDALKKKNTTLLKTWNDVDAQNILDLETKIQYERDMIETLRYGRERLRSYLSQ